MKKHIVLLFILSILVSKYSFSQNRFIEVVVKDTISLKPISYEFQVSSGLDFEYDYENPNGKLEYAKKLRESEDKLISLFRKFGYDFRLNKNPEANFTRKPTDKVNYLVTLYDSIQKEMFKERMIKEEFEFHMTDIKHEKKETKIKEIYTRLLAKAKKRAQLIADLSNKEIGDILEISESKSELNIISSFIESFSYSRSYGASSTSYQFNSGVLEKSLLVKFSVK